MTYAEAIRLLHVAPGAPIEVVEAAFRVLAKQAHPDVGGNTVRMAALNVAIDTIRSTGPGFRLPPKSTEPPSASVRMPWGKHVNVQLREIPSDYFAWLLKNATGMRPELRRDIEAVVSWRHAA